jgi:dUTP pyrophosphatase
MIIDTKVADPDYVPYRNHDFDAGADLVSIEKVTIPAGKNLGVHTGVAIDLPVGYVALMFSRSGMGKRGLRLANCVGVIDAGYQGELIAMVHNDTSSDYIIQPGERIAQLVVMPIERPKFRVVEDFVKESDRGTDGFGSTGN